MVILHRLHGLPAHAAPLAVAAFVAACGGDRPGSDGPDASRPDTSIDLAAELPDTAGADSLEDPVHDSAPEAIADTSPEAAPDTAHEAVADIAPEAVPDTAPEADPDTSPEAVADTSPETALDTAPEAVADIGPDVDACPPPPVPPGQVRARTLACAAELPVGTQAVARVGDIVLENALVRFVIRTGPEGHALLGLAGGGLVDALQDGGPDLLREFQPLVSFNVVRPDTIEVVAAGADGEAVARVSGVPVPHPVLESMIPGIPLDATVIQEYRLAPDQAWLRLRTRVRPIGGGELEIIPGDLQMLGGEARPFVPGSASGDQAGISGPFFAVSGGGASFAYVVRGGVGGLEVGGSEIFLAGAMFATDTEEAVFERFFVVGDGSVSSVAGIAYELRGDAWAEVAGRVLVAGAHAGSAYRVEVEDAGGLPVSRFDTRSDGTFAGRLPIGAAVLHATCEGCPDGPRVPVVVPATGLADVALQAGSPSFLDILVREAGKGPVPARVSIGAIERPDERPRFLFTTAGTTRFPLAPGTYTVTVSRGMEYERDVRSPVVVTEGQTLSIEVDLVRSVNTEGAVAAEFHLHSEASVDSSIPTTDRVAACAAEGLEFVASSDHDFVTDYGPTIDALGLRPFLQSAVGCEVSSVAAGHFITWPIAVDPDRAGNGAPQWFGLPPGDLVDLLRSAHPDSVVQVNHPRYEDKSTFDLVRYDPADGHAHADPVDLGFPPGTDLDRLDYDSYEVFNAIGHNDLEEQLRDWFSLLNLGRRITATAGGDSHTLDAFPGHPRNLVLLGNDDPAQTSPQAVVEALRRMRVLVTSGPYVRAGAVPPAGGEPSLPGDLVTDTDGEMALRVEVQAPTWMDVDEVVVVMNGQAGTPIAVPAAVSPGPQPVLRYAATLAMPVLADAWFVVIARGDARDPVLLNRAPVAVTNPVYIDADGDGAFTPPGLSR